MSPLFSAVAAWKGAGRAARTAQHFQAVAAYDLDRAWEHVDELRIGRATVRTFKCMETLEAEKQHLVPCREAIEREATSRSRCICGMIPSMSTKGAVVCFSWFEALARQTCDLANGALESALAGSRMAIRASKLARNEEVRAGKTWPFTGGPRLRKSGKVRRSLPLPS